MSQGTYSENEKNKYLEGFKNSTCMVYDYARKNNIPVNVFRRWLREENEPKFGAIELGAVFSADIPAKNSNFKFESSNIKIELKENYDRELLRKIMEVILDVK